MSEQQAVIKYQPHPRQADVHASKARFRIVRAGTRWGKTKLGVYEAFWILGKPKAKVWWVSPSWTETLVAWRMFFDEIPALLISDVDKTHHAVEMVNGSRIWFKCYDKETEALTKNGWKRIGEVSFDDEVATLNSLDYLQYQKPTHLYSYEYSGKMYKLQTRFIDILVTPNHKLFVKPEESSWQLIAAEEAFGRRMEFKRGCKWIGKNQKFFSIAGKKIESKIWLEFLGYYITEGDCEKCGVRITQKSSVEKIRKIEKCLQQMPFKFKAESRGLYISSRKLSEYLTTLGHNAGKKHLPHEILLLNGNLLKVLLDAMILGDGYFKGGLYPQMEFDSTSEKLVNQIQEIALKTGYSGIVRRKPAQDIPFKDYIIHSKKQFHFSVAQHSLTPLLHSSRNSRRSKRVIEEWVQHSGPVYCIEVPNHIILVRRNGKMFWCGNSAEDYQHLRAEGLDFVVVDEAARMKREAWFECLRPRLSDYDRMGKALFLSTPEGINWFYELYMLGNLQGSDWECFHYPTWTNPYILPEEIESARREMPEALFRQEYGAEFLSDLGSIFRLRRDAENRLLNVRDSLEHPKQGEEYVAGVDLGKRLSFTVCTIFERKTGHMVAFDRFKEVDWPLQVKRVTNLAREYNAEIYVDSTGIGEPIFDFLIREYPRVKPVQIGGTHKKLMLIDNLALMIEQVELTWPDIPEILSEIQVFGIQQGRSGVRRYEAPCFLPGTEVLGNSGLKKIETYLKDDSVLTHEGEMKAIEEVFEKDYSGKTYSLKIIGLPSEIECTPNHPFYSIRRNKSFAQRRARRRVSEPSFIQANELRKGDLVFFPKRRNLPQIEYPDDLLYAFGWWLAEGWIRRDRWGAAVVGMEQRENNKLFEIASIFEKYYPKPEKVKSKGFVNWKGDVVPPYMRRIFNRPQFKISKHRNRNIWSLKNYNQRLADDLEGLFGNGARTKKLSLRIFNSKGLLPLILGWLEGDGHQRKNQQHDVTGTTFSKDLAFQIRQILFDHGIYSTLQAHTAMFRPSQARREGSFTNFSINMKNKELSKFPPNHKFTISNRRPCQYHIEKEDGFFVPIKKIVEREFSGKIYDLKIKDGCSYNASGIAVHNSGFSDDIVLAMALAAWGLKKKGSGPSFGILEW